MRIHGVWKGLSQDKHWDSFASVLLFYLKDDSLMSALIMKAVCNPCNTCSNMHVRPKEFFLNDAKLTVKDTCGWLVAI